MKKTSASPSIEASLVSLGTVAVSLIAVLLVVLVAVGQALGGRLEQMQHTIVPAERAVSASQQAVARLFQRQSQMLSTRSGKELLALQDRSGLENELQRSQAQLIAALKNVMVGDAARVGEAAIEDGLKRLLLEDAALYSSVSRRHSFQEQLNTGNAQVQTALQALIREAKAVAGEAHLGYVLALRRAVSNPSPAEVRKLVFGGERVQQEAANQFVSAALHLGQLGGKIALAATHDELNSIAANELAQSLDRSRAFIQTLLANLQAGTAVHTRARNLQQTFEQVSLQVSDVNQPASLINLRRSVLSEAEKSMESRQRVADSVHQYSASLDATQHDVFIRSERSAEMAELTLWITRLGTALMLAAAVWVGVGSFKRMRESVGRLRAQNLELETLSSELKGMNGCLEELVARRSAQLLERERSMRLVLDTVEEALVLCDLNGQVIGESSKAAMDWFGACAPGSKIWHYLGPGDDKFEAQFCLGFEQVAEDILPFDVAVRGLPRRLARDGRTYALDFKQGFEDGEFRSVLVTVKDVTSLVATEARERDAREQQTLLANLLKDRVGFRAFVRDGEALLTELRAQPGHEPAMRALHTLKGNTAMYGMESVARACHELEERLAEGGQSLTVTELDDLSNQWRLRTRKIQEMIKSDGSLELAEADYVEMVTALRRRQDYAQLTSLVESWKWGSTQAHLQRLARQVRRVAERLGKDVDVCVEHNRLRVMPGPLDTFWGALVHVVRNAVDHGIEWSEERIAAGKPARGRVTLRTLVVDGQFVVELQDDGRGIDFEALADVASRQGLPHRTRQELVRAMFHDGVTTRTEATELSGRGIGLAAVGESCERAGGRVDCETSVGGGTTFRFTFAAGQVRVRQGEQQENVVSRRSQLPRSGQRINTPGGSLVRG